MTKWYTSDLHLGHDKILEYTRRGEVVSTIKEHDDWIIGRINEYVKPGDEVYFVGDVALYDNVWECVAAISRIECRHKFLVTGNHDMSNGRMLAYAKSGVFEDICPVMLVKDRGVIATERPAVAQFALSHWPMAHWPSAEYGAYHLHGHLHGNKHSMPEELYKYRLVDVGVDPSMEYFSDGTLNRFSYRPLNFSDIMTFIGHREIKPRRHDK